MLGRSAAGAVTTQFVTAGGSFVLQLLAARTLGADGYGAFMLLVSILVAVTALQSAWVGDCLTVLDRFNPEVRGAIIASQVGFSSAGAVLSTLLALALDVLPLAPAVLFGLLVALWTTEEAVRRVFMARTQFWALVANDLLYVGVIFAVIALESSASRLSLTSFVVAMSAGSVASIVLAVMQLPRAEFAMAPLTWAGARQVTAFAGWRAAQAGIRPVALLLARSLVAGLASRAALGRIEAARLLLAPALTLVNGSGSFLLPLFVAEDRSPGGRSRVSVRFVTIVLVSVTGTYGAVVWLAAGRLSDVLTGGSFTTDRVALAGWIAFALLFAAGLPPALAAVARRQVREVFAIRALDSVAGLVLAGLALAAHRPGAVPAALAVGMLMGTVLLHRLAARSPAAPS